MTGGGLIICPMLWAICIRINANGAMQMRLGLGVGLGVEHCAEYRKPMLCYSNGTDNTALLHNGARCRIHLSRHLILARAGKKLGLIEKVLGFLRFLKVFKGF